MNSPPSPLKILWTGALLALVAVAWVNFGPRQLGGSVSYVMTHGISMEPRVHEGDLVIVRESAPYEKGDVIAYDSAALRQPVMHRIVGGDEGRYITQGDNNAWLDIDRPTDADVIGKEWIHVPRAGKILAWFAVPRNAAALAAAAGLLLFGGSKKARKSGRRSERPAMQTMTVANFKRLEPTGQVALGTVACVALASLLLGLLGFTKEAVTAVSQESAYEHRGSFTYEASARESTVYPDGEANTGGPLFLKLIDDVRFTFAYSLDSDAEREVAGTAGLRARINDDHGWQKTLLLQPPTEFRGNQVKVSGQIDPQGIQDLISEVQTLTGVAGSFTLTIVPLIEMEGSVGGERVSETFSPPLTFGLEGLQMTPPSTDPTTGESSPFTPSEPGSIKVSDLAENSIALGPLEISVPGARKSSLLGLGIALLLGFLLWGRLARSLDDDEAAAIEARYGSWLVPVAELATSGKRVQVVDMDSLVRLADRYERMILHANNELGHTFAVQEDGVDYVFELPLSTPRAEVNGSVRRPQRPRREARRTSERDELRDGLRAQLHELEAELASREISDVESE